MRLNLRAFSLALLFGASSCSGLQQRPLTASPTPGSYVPPPLPCTCAAPPLAAEYLVFFDWGTYALRPKELPTIALVASDNKVLSFGHLILFGNIDTSEASAGYNRLSLERALAVRDQLIADGIAPAKIEIRSNGSKKLLVPTRSNVRLYRIPPV
jgi:OOP family OmpA-OmpF porin